MTTTRTRSEIGKSNNRKGKETERDVVKFLRENGFPHAERAERTGYRTPYRVLVDPLDILGVPGVVWSVKADKRATVRLWLREAETIRQHQQATLAVLVTRRSGYGNPARWWAYMRLDQWARLWNLPSIGTAEAPVCLELGEALPVLRSAGYGTPWEATE